MDKQIDAGLVRHIGKLSRIELSAAQAEAFGRQLAAVLAYFDKLNELDTSAVEPMVHAVEIHNVLADDVPRELLSTEQALANAPQRDGNFFKVPKVIEDS